MRQIGFVLTITLTALCFGMGCMKQPVTYAIKLDQPVKVGDKLDVVASGSQKQKTTTTTSGADPTEDNNSSDYQIAGVCEVISVDTKGRPTKVSFTVAKATRIEAGQTVELVPPGTVVLVESKDVETIITPSDSSLPLAPEAVRAFTTAALVIPPEKCDDDEILGTRTRQVVGATWDMNAEAGQKDIGERCNYTVSGLNGKVTLNGATKIEGFDCLEYGLTISYSISTRADLPPCYKIEKSEYKATGTYIIPVSREITPLIQVMTVNSTGAMTIKTAKTDGQEVTIQIDTETTFKKSVRAKAK